MASYLKFETDHGELLVETEDAAKAGSATGEEKAGLGQWVKNQSGEAIAVAQTGFEQAVHRAVGVNARAFLAAVSALEAPPDEVELTFGLKGVGEVGNVAVGKVSGECSYQVKMVWRSHPTAKLPA